MHFAVLVTAFAVVAIGASLYVFAQSDRDGRRDAQRDARFAARTAAKQISTSVAVLRTTVEKLTATPQIGQALTNPKACALSFSGPGGLEAGHIDIVRADGTVTCSSRPSKPGAKLTGYAGAAWLRDARAGQLFRAPVVDAASGGRAVLAAGPIPGGVVAAFLALEPAGPGLVRLFGGGHPMEFLVTTGDTVLMRSIAPRGSVGRSVAGTDFAKAGSATERRDLDGTHRIYASAPVAGVGWRFHAGEDEHAALAASHRLRDRELVIILAGLTLVLAAAIAVYRRVALPVRRLGTAVRATSENDPPRPVAASGPAEVTALGEDVNGLIAAVGRELEERGRAERNYRLLFERSPLAMLVHDRESHAVLEVNDAAITAYGYSREELLGLELGEIEVSGSSHHRRRDGSEFEVRTIVHDVDFGDRPARLVIAEDVGERGRLERQLHQAQRMEAIGRLAGGVAHDFNNLLTAILGYTDLVLTTTPPEDGRHGEIQEIKQAGERAVALTRQLLTFGRGQVLDPVVLDLSEMVEGLTPMLRRLIRENVTIDHRLAAGSARVNADRSKIEQVIVNLVVNAGDAMPDGGRLTLATAEVELDDDYFVLHPAGWGEPGRYAMLEVTDTGTGMDEETLSHIFEPFFTTKGDEHGTGLGLATVYGIVRQSGGFLWAYSEPGRGTSFKAYLPLVEADVEAAPEPPPVVSLAGAGRTALLVEDDAAVRAVVRRMLEAREFSIVEAEAGDEALALSGDCHPDSLTLLVTDTIIPGPGGIDLAERVRARHPALGTVVMSGYSDRLATGEIELGEATEFIAKPFSATDLYAKVASVLG